SLLVGRVHARERELAVRSALGATRGRLARQLVAETLVLCLLGMVVGLTLAFWGTKVMLLLVPGSLPRADDVGFDWRVLSFAGLLALIAALGFGVAAAYAARLRFTRAAMSVSRTRRVLVMTEVALSLILLIGAALLTRSFISLQQVRPGFDPSNALTARVTIPLVGRPQPLVDGARWSATFDHIIARLASAPGIVAAGGVVDDVKTVSLDGDAPPQVYVPLSQLPAYALTLVVRVSGADPLAALPLVRQTVHEVHSSATLKEIRTFESVVADSLAPQRFNMTLIATFAVLALVLAFVGLYGVLAVMV